MKSNKQNYVGRSQNYATKSQEPKNIKKAQLDKFQNKTKDILQYREQIEEFNSRRYSGINTTKNTGFTGFGNPQRRQEKKARPDSKHVSIDSRNSALHNNKLQTRSAKIQKLQTDQKNLPS